MSALQNDDHVDFKLCDYCNNEDTRKSCMVLICRVPILTVNWVCMFVGGVHSMPDS
jgi:hypothetical protein